MDKRVIENERVKKAIEESLFALLDKKSFSAIKVSDIVKEAHVARASYYRNFDSKEEIIQSYIERQRSIIAEAIHYQEENTDWLIQENLTISLEHYLKQKYYLITLYKNGFSTLILEELGWYASQTFGDMPYNSVKKYILYAMVGAVFNITIQWLLGGAVESPTAIGKEILLCINSLMESGLKEEI